MIDHSVPSDTAGHSASQSDVVEVLPRGPVQPGERIVLLDVLRGFALLGIAQVNWLQFEGTAGNVLDFLVSGTFYSSFATLFGLGFAMQLLRAEERKQPFVLRYIWRSLLLFAIGAVHAIFLWKGDVVAGYAVLALVLLLFVRLPAPLILTLAVLMLAFSMAPGRWVPDVGLVNLGRPFVSVDAAAQRLQRDSVTRANARIRALADSGKASYWAGVRASGLEADLPGRLLRFTNLRGLKGQAEFLALFLLGLWIGRRRLLQNAVRETRVLTAVAVLGLLLGVAGNAQTVFGAFQLPAALRGWRLAWSVGNISLGLFYLSSIALLFTHSEFWRRVLSPLGYVGRMGLTNYIVQSIVMTALLNGRYLGLESRLGNGLLLLGVVNALFLAQVVYSRWWFQRYCFGPIEWVWRSATWMRRQDFRVWGQPTVS